MDELAPWLAARVPRPVAVSVVHNDFKLDNMMLDPADPGRVVAVHLAGRLTQGDQPLGGVGAGEDRLGGNQLEVRGLDA